MGQVGEIRSGLSSSGAEIVSLRERAAGPYGHFQVVARIRLGIGIPKHLPFFQIKDGRPGGRPASGVAGLAPFAKRNNVGPT